MVDTYSDYAVEQQAGLVRFVHGVRAENLCIADMVLKKLKMRLETEVNSEVGIHVRLPRLSTPLQAQV